MTIEAIRLRSWYVTPQGRAAAKLVGEVMFHSLGGALSGTTLGFGFLQPYAEMLGGGVSGWWGAAPAEMGVAPWLSPGGHQPVLVRPNALCFPDECFDQVIMAHLLEGTESPSAALRETWRVLKPGGRLLVLVPNRVGWWARSDHTPFGWGRPFSPLQLQELLQESFFIPMGVHHALFAPPFSGDWWLRMAPRWERISKRWFGFLGGVIVGEAEKTVYATTPLTPMDRRGFGLRPGLMFPVTENRPWGSGASRSVPQTVTAPPRASHSARIGS